MPTSSRSSTNPDSARTGVAIAAPGEIVGAAERATFETHVGIIKAAPGAALLVWGPEAICLAYNRAYRSLAALRASALGKPLFASQPELERAWRGKLDQVFAGKGVALESADFIPAMGGEAARSFGAEPHAGWLLPVTDAEGRVRGALVLFMDVAPVVEPYRRVLQTVAQELRDALVSVRLVAERLSRVPKITAERCIADLGRILEITAEMDRSAHDLTLFARVASGAIQLNPRACDLGVIVQSVCDELSSPIELGAPSSRADSSLPPRSTLSPPPSSAQTPSSRPPPSVIRASVVDVQGSWDPDAIRWIVVNMVTSARKHGNQGGEIGVSVLSGREGAVIVVRAEGRGLRDEDLDFFDPAKRSTGVMVERRRTGLGLELFLARALVEAHGGRLSCERVAMTSFLIRAVLPVAAAGSAPRRG